MNYVECADDGPDADPAACAAAGIRGYPTWVFADGTETPGNVPLSSLAEKTGCVL